MRKRVLSLCMALAMCLSLLPNPVLALESADVTADEASSGLRDAVLVTGEDVGLDDAVKTEEEGATSADDESSDAEECAEPKGVDYGLTLDAEDGAQKNVPSESEETVQPDELVDDSDPPDQNMTDNDDSASGDMESDEQVTDSDYLNEDTKDSDFFVEPIDILDIDGLYSAWLRGEYPFGEEDDATELLAADSITSYSQTDSRWKDYPYGHKDERCTVPATLGTSGCGILSYTNAIYYLNGTFIDPRIIADYALEPSPPLKHRHRICGVGTATSLYKAFADDYGDKYGFSYVGSVDGYKKLRENLESGYVAICSKPGHIMCIVDYRASDKKFLLLDSYRTDSRGTKPNGYAWKTETQLDAINLRSTFYLLRNEIEKPDKPVIISVEGTSADTIVVKWRKVDNAKTYDVSVRPAGNNTQYSLAGKDLTGTSFTITGLKSAKRYWVRVKAKNDNGTNESDKVAGYTLIPKPTVERETDKNGNRVMVLKWKAPTDAKSYTVKRKRYDDEHYKTVAENITGTTWTDTTVLESGTKYLYRVYAQCEKDGVIYDVRSVSRAKFWHMDTPKAVSVTESKVSLSWSAVKGDSGYKYSVIRKQKSEPDSAWKVVKSPKESLTSFVDKTVKQNTAYQYRILVTGWKTNNKGKSVSAAGVKSAVLTVTTKKASKKVVAAGGSSITSPGVYNISFDTNGGIGTLSSRTVSVAKTTSQPVYTLPECDVVNPEGLEFEGYMINGEEYTPGTSLALQDENVEVTLKWKDKDTESDKYVSFDPGEGTGNMETALVDDGGFTFPQCSFNAPTGKQFRAWSFNNAEYQPGDSYSFGGDSADETNEAELMTSESQPEEIPDNLKAVALYEEASGESTGEDNEGTPDPERGEILESEDPDTDNQSDPPQPSKIAYGDVYRNDGVNAIDVTALARYVATGWPGFTKDEINLANANVYYDDKVNALDVTVLARHVATGWEAYEELPFTPGSSRSASLSSIDFADLMANPAIKANSVEVEAGQAGQIQISLDNNPGVVAVNLWINYDKERLTLTNIEDGGILGTPDHGGDKTQVPYHLYWHNDTSRENFSENGTIATLTFQVREDAPADNYPITITPDSAAGMYNVDLTLYAPDIQIGSIQVKSGEHEHSLTKTAAVAATCETDGNIEYWTCSGCDKLFSDAEGKNEITQEATIVKAKGHSLTRVEAKAATCEMDGNIEYWTCSDCGKLFRDAGGKNAITPDETIVKATGHNWGKWVVTKPATETAEGEETRTCQNDASHTETRTIPKLPPHTHSLTKTAAVAATCETDGNIEYWTCSGCDKLFSDTEGKNLITPDEIVVKATGHNWGEWIVTRAATEEAEGEETRTCKNNPSHTETRTIPKLTPTKHKVTVNEGSGSGDYQAGSSVSITANPAPDGKEFDKWKGTDGLTFTSGGFNTAQAVFVMPSTDLTLTATYRNITDQPGTQGCYVATAVYGSYDCAEVWTLRRFRDRVLAKTWYGRLFIRLYYAASPTAVRLFGQTRWFQNFFRSVLDPWVADLQKNGFDSTPYNDMKW